MAPKTPALNQRWLGWQTICQGGKFVGIKRQSVPARTISAQRVEDRTQAVLALESALAHQAKVRGYKGRHSPSETSLG